MASLLSWLGDRLKDVEKGIGGAVNDVGRTVSQAFTPQPQQQPRPQAPVVSPTQRPQYPKFNTGIGALSVPRPQAPRLTTPQPPSQGPTFNDVGNFFLGGTAKLANQAFGVVEKAGVNLAGEAQKAFGDKQGGERTIREGEQSINDRLLKPGTGVFGAGGIYQSTDALHNAKIPEVIQKVGGTGLQSASELIPIGKGITVAKGAAPLVQKIANGALQGSLAGGVGNAGAQIAENGKVDPAESLKSLAVGGVLGGGIPLVSKGVSKLVPKVPDSMLRASRPEIGQPPAPIQGEGAVKTRLPQVPTRNTRLVTQEPFSPRNLPQSQVNPSESRLPNISQSLSQVPEPTIVATNHRVEIPGTSPQASLSAQTVPENSAIYRQSYQTNKLSLPGGSLRQRGFIDTVKNDANTTQNVKNSVSSLYKVRNTADLQTKAANLVKDSPDMALRVARAGDGDISVATGSELIKHYQSRGNHEAAIDLTNEIAAQLTRAGQTAQAAAIYGRLTPEGILRFATNQLKQYNVSNNITESKRLKLTPEQAQSLSETAKAIQSMSEGREKNLAIKEMLNDVYKLVPSSLVQKVSTAQTIAQLLNPKTTARNVLGNAIFGGLDNISQVGAAGADKLMSKVLKTDRTVALPNLKVQANGLKQGGKEAYEEVMRGVNLGPDTQFDLKEVPTYRKGLMANLEKTMGVTLRVPDRAAYQAAFDDTVNGLTRARGITNPTPDILELAHANGLYRTFQDNSKAAQLFSGLKKSLNQVGFKGKDGSTFGLGDLILKYPKTPGNIIARGLDYSPVGIVKGITTLAVHAAQHQPFDQAAFANSISRGVVGSTVMGGGAVLGALGIITEKPSQDRDTRDVQKASGQGGYQINQDALSRFVMSGFNKDQARLKEGDTLVSYDWAQPVAIPLSAGASVGKGGEANSAIDTVSGGVNTLVEQPLVTGVNTFANNIKNKGIVGALGESAKGAPASFVPTGSNQLRQLADNTSRSTYDPSVVQESLNKVVNRIPGLSSTLPAQITSLGEEKKNYQDGGNNIFNVGLNPAFVNKYIPNEAAKLALDIQARSGETKQMPRTTDTTQTVNGSPLKLTSKQNHDFQQYVGEKTATFYNLLKNDPEFQAKSDTEKASIMSRGLTDISKAAKIAILGDSPDNASASAKALADRGDVTSLTKKSTTKGTKVKAPKVAKTRKSSGKRKGKGRKSTGSIKGMLLPKTSVPKTAQPPSFGAKGAIASASYKQTPLKRYSRKPITPPKGVRVKQRVA